MSLLTAGSAVDCHSIATVVLHPCHVSDGSKGGLTAPKRDFRYSLGSGYNSDIAGGPKSANRVTSHCDTGALFNHLVGTGEKHWWHGDADCLCGLEIDYKIEFCRLLNGNIRRRFASQNLVHKRCGAPVQ